MKKGRTASDTQPQAQLAMYDPTQPPDASQASPTPAGLAPSPLQTAHRKQQQHQMMIQLRNSIGDTYQAPPDGVTEEEVITRRGQLQELLRLVETQYSDTQREALEAYNLRWRQALEAQEGREARYAKQQDDRHKSAQEALQERNDYIAAVRRQRNDQLQQNTIRSMQHLAAEAERRLDTINANSRKKEELYASIKRAREEEARRHQQRQQAKEKHCSEMLQRRDDILQEHRDTVERKANANREAADARLQQLREQKDQEASQRAARAAEAKHGGNVNKVAVILRPTPQLVIVKMDYEARLKEVNDKDVARATAAKEAQEQTRLERAVRQGRFTTLRDAQEQHMQEIYVKNEQRREDTRSRLAAEDRHVELVKAERDRMLKERGDRKHQLILDHMAQQRALEHGHKDATKRRVYDRWNRQLSDVVTTLGGNIAASGGSGAAAASGSSNAGSYQQPQPPRAVQAPRPPKQQTSMAAAAAPSHNGGGSFFLTS